MKRLSFFKIIRTAEVSGGNKLQEKSRIEMEKSLSMFKYALFTIF